MTSSLSRHPAFLSLQGGINFRDLGGQLAADGRRVRSGKLLRSGALNRLTAEDLNHLDTLPLSRVLDYRVLRTSLARLPIILTRRPIRR